MARRGHVNGERGGVQRLHCKHPDPRSDTCLRAATQRGTMEGSI